MQGIESFTRADGARFVLGVRGTPCTVVRILPEDHPSRLPRVRTWSYASEDLARGALARLRWARYG